jgi:hypothetical protein
MGVTACATCRWAGAMGLAGVAECEAHFVDLSGTECVVVVGDVFSRVAGRGGQYDTQRGAEEVRRGDPALWLELDPVVEGRDACEACEGEAAEDDGLVGRHVLLDGHPLAVELDVEAARQARGAGTGREGRV